MCHKKAVIAIAHKLAKAIYAIVHDDKEYEEKTDSFFLLYRYEKDLKLLSRLTERLGKDVVKMHIEDIPDVPDIPDTNQEH
ncbi:MAG: hypothetical protein PHY48_03120 [Candidatus Cloacimonetes bacterium]|nr:hypothetical protein [Candidatus Cloacimonadota bacterium]